MARELRLEQRDGARSTVLAEGIERKARALTRAEGHAAPQIRQGEGAPPVASVVGAQQREQRGVLTDRKQLPAALGPPPGREDPREDADFCKERVHDPSSALR